MKCKVCGYQLWNVQGHHNCPECGNPFKISDYNFKPNAVSFCCPHCDQDYYGTDEHGLLEPRAFDCVKCQQPIEMDQMVVRPLAGYEDSASATTEHPWEGRGENKGSLRAWVRTAKAAMFTPSELVQFPATSDRVSGHWSFLALNLLMTMLVGYGSMSLVFILMAVAGGAGGPGGGGAPGVGFMVGTLLMQAVIAIPFALLFMLLFGAFVHLFLRLVAKPEGELTDTYRCMCYSQGVNALTAIPVCGMILGYVTGIWALVSFILMLCKAHKVSGFQATLAAFILPLVAMMLFVGSIIAVIMLTIDPSNF
ncbi:MAG: YIP1 family protein [Phycisphaeraceae bacterium JB051]